MKNKTKKILAGLGIGLALGSSAMLTGCSSDITFNQKDLDNVVSNVNAYLENTQNNNSDYVKNTLNELIINAMNNSIGVGNISYTSVSEQYAYGIKSTTQKEIYKRNIVGQVRKEYYSKTDNNQTRISYTEITKKPSETLSSIYDVEEYVIDWDNKKEYTKTENTSELSSLPSYSEFKDYVDVYSSIIYLLNNSNQLTMSDFVKSVENDLVTYKCMAMNPEYIDNSSIVGSMIIVFRNEKIVKLESINTSYSTNRYDDYYAKQTIIFDYENEAISFDKTGFNTSTTSND